jgi:hypothetical protein
METKEYGSYTTSEDIKGRKSNPNIVWIGAKFDKTDEFEAEVCRKFEAILKKSGSVKRTIAEMVLFVNDRI